MAGRWGGGGPPAPHEAWEVGAGPGGAGAPLVEVDDVSGAAEVSVPGWPEVATRRPGGASLARACLAASAVLVPHPALGHGVISRSSLLSPLIDLTPSCRPGTWRIKTELGSLSRLWVSDVWTVHWVACWHGYCCWSMSRLFALLKCFPLGSGAAGRGPGSEQSRLRHGKAGGRVCGAAGWRRGGVFSRGPRPALLRAAPPALLLPRGGSPRRGWM